MQEKEIWMNETRPESSQLREDTELEMMLNMMFAAVFVLAIIIANVLLLAVIWKFKLIQPCNRLIHTMVALTYSTTSLSKQ